MLDCGVARVSCIKSACHMPNCPHSACFSHSQTLHTTVFDSLPVLPPLPPPSDPPHHPTAADAGCPSTAAAEFRGLQGFEDPDAALFSVAVLGDLHLEPPHMDYFHAARRQLVAALEQQGGATRVVQLGDLGGYKYKPGSQACFDRGRDYLANFGLPAALVLGNHGRRRWCVGGSCNGGPDGGRANAAVCWRGRGVLLSGSFGGQMLGAIGVGRWGRWHQERQRPAAMLPPCGVVWCGGRAGAAPDATSPVVSCCIGTCCGCWSCCSCPGVLWHSGSVASRASYLAAAAATAAAPDAVSIFLMTSSIIRRHGGLGV